VKLAPVDAPVPHRMLANLRYYRRRAERRGRLRAEQPTAASLDEAIEALFALHTARWSGRSAPGVLAGPAVQAFHRKAIREMQAHGTLAMHVVRLNDAIIAVSYGFRYCRRSFYYLGGFDPTCADLSPGTLAIGAAIEHATRSGARTFDFLRGRERYKYLWGAVDRPTARWQLTCAPRSLFADVLPARAAPA
jgi:CelD/BcsL family acetyltransferase involved in cellulose biosynthesis